MTAKLQEAITRKVQQLSETGQRQVMQLIDELIKEEPVNELRRHEEQPAADHRSIGEIFAELSGKVPLEDWKKLPEDGAEQHDHYLYGAPKKINP